ncbi:MAG: DUF445 family protein [Leptotrichiaceae bacterium]|nr:DUF445 family protein [Leptotrichiaceae bacterium]MBP6168108.1 DUF445 family protein [Leptotrichiaceae bacterium]MBP7026252.1 DUF445 family protein [Leptotrichiaceae bacterium]MBP8636736.1 DUF445 family protein [Leptotrichiaceae bacterium]MBP9538952.1 DUF445 family protein [Leptotrichiaceae bacterium]
MMQTKSMADRALFFAVLIFIIVTGLLMSKNLSSLAIVFKIIQLISAAAIIGGVADWYGVVSIYGKPLGINWKTEIVISKKKELVTGISDFICDDILSKSNIVSKFENMNFANRIANIFSIRDVNNEDIFNYFSDFIVEVLWVSSDKIDRSEFLKNIDALLSILTKSTSPTLETTKFVKFLIDDDHHIELIDAMIPEIRKMIQRDNFKGFINSIVSNAADAYCEDNSLRTTFSSRIEESFNFEVMKIISKTLDDIENNDEHVVKVESKRIINNYIEQLENETNSKKYDDKIYNSIKEMNLSEHIYNEVNKIKYSFGKEKFKKSVSEIIEKLVSASTENPENQDKINNYIIEIVSKLLEKHHQQLKNTIENNLFSMKDEELVMFLRESTENELQNIRLNGMLFGVLFGIIIVGVRLALNLM